MYMNISIVSMKITLLLNNFTGEYEPSGVNIVLGIFYVIVFEYIWVKIISYIFLLKMFAF